MKNFKGFSLLEIVITVVVLGVLASVAIPKYLEIIEKSRGAEAREILYKAYAGYKRLVVEGEDVSWPGIDNWARLGMSDPNALPSPPRHFRYRIRKPGGDVQVEARSLDDLQERLRLYLANGTLVKTSPY